MVANNVTDERCLDRGVEIEVERLESISSLFGQFLRQVVVVGYGNHLTSICTENRQVFNFAFWRK
ncbi:hypothetical protein D3C80_1772470 [compost metagenome]